MTEDPQAGTSSPKEIIPPISIRSRGEVWAQIVMHQPPFPQIEKLHLPTVPAVGSLVQIAVHSGLNTGRVQWVNFTPYEPSHTVVVGISFEAPSAPPTGASAQSDELQHRMEKALEWQARAHEKLVGYTNVITLAGYAGIFALWGFVKDKIGTRMTLWTGILLGISLIIYVLYELYCMVQRTSALHKRARHINDKPEKFMKAIAGIEKDERELAFRNNRIWAIAFWPTAATGLGAAALLLFAMVRSLIHATN